MLTECTLKCTKTGNISDYSHIIWISMQVLFDACNCIPMGPIHSEVELSICLGVGNEPVAAVVSHMNPIGNSILKELYSARQTNSDLVARNPWILTWPSLIPCCRDSSSSIAGRSFLVANAAADTHHIIFCSDGFCKMTGYTRAEVMQRSACTEFLHGPMTAQSAVAAVKEALIKGLEKHFEILYYRKSGE